MREDRIKEIGMVKITNTKMIFVCVTEIRKQFPSLPLIDCARGYWRVGKKSEQCDMLAAVESGKIIGVWDIDHTFGWRPMGKAMIVSRSERMDPTRKVCQLLLRKENGGHGLVGKSVRMHGPVDYSF